MSNRLLVLVDLVIVSSLVGLVTKEVYGGVLLAAVGAGLVLEMLEAIGLIPTRWEDVEGDLASDGVAVLVSRCSVIQLVGEGDGK